MKTHVCAVFLIAFVPCCVSACEPGSVVDPRFATPERTVATLLGAHGLRGLDEAQIRARLIRGGGLEVGDRAAYEACFVDLAEAGEGRAAYVVGLLAARVDHLRFEIVGDRASVFPRQGVRVAMVRREGAYRIELATSSAPPAL